jgi:hypothetical protein
MTLKMEQHSFPKSRKKHLMLHSKNPRRPLSDWKDCLWLGIKNIAIRIFLVSPLSSSQPYLFTRNVICFLWVFIFNTILQTKYHVANRLISCATEETINYTQFPVPETLLSPSADADRNVTPFTKILYSRGNSRKCCQQYSKSGQYIYWNGLNYWSKQVVFGLPFLLFDFSSPYCFFHPALFHFLLFVWV